METPSGGKIAHYSSGLAVVFAPPYKSCKGNRIEYMQDLPELVCPKINHRFSNTLSSAAVNEKSVFLHSCLAGCFLVPVQLVV